MPPMLTEVESAVNLEAGRKQLFDLKSLGPHADNPVSQAESWFQTIFS